MILITHIDLDGVGAEIVARYFCPSLSKNMVHHCNYDNVDGVVRKCLDTTNETIVITDISVGKPLADYIDEKHAGRVELYDHHKTAGELLKPYEWAYVDSSRSGTRILFETLAKRHPELEIADGLKTLVFHVNDYDLWLRESPDSHSLNSMLTLLGKESFAELMLKRIHDGEPLIFPLDRLYLQGLEQHKRKYFAERVKNSTVVGNRIVVIATRHLSELSQYIRDIDPPPVRWKDVDYIDMLNFEYSAHALRSYNPQFDVSEIASRNGGGGHQRAAGYPMTIPESWIRQL